MPDDRRRRWKGSRMFPRRGRTHQGAATRASTAALVSARASVVAAALVTGPLAAQTAVDTDLAREYFAEAEAVSDADGGELWGHELYGRMLFADPASRSAVANAADECGVLEEADGVWTGILPEEVGIANTSVEWCGQRWTVVVWPPPSGRYERRRLLAHELYHRIQPELGMTAANPGNAHLDTEEGRVWLRLEWRALARALGHSGEERRRAVMDALRFRDRRRRRFPEGAAEERALELNEGLAEFTGIRAAIPPNARAGWTVRQLESHDVQARRSSVVRSFAYASGPAYGLLLDDRDPGWRSRVGPDTDLGSLLMRAYGLPESAVAADEDEGRLALYDAARLRMEEAEREERRLAREARFRDRFIDGPTLSLPPGSRFGYAFDPNAVVPYADVGTVYLTARVNDEWGSLEVEEGGVLLVRRDGRVVRVVVPAPRDPAARPLAGDGWTLELADGWVLDRTDDGGWVVKRVDGTSGGA